MMSINQGVSPGEGRKAQQTLTTLLLKFFPNVWENENGGAIPKGEKKFEDMFTHFDRRTGRWTDTVPWCRLHYA